MKELRPLFDEEFDRLPGLLKGKKELLVVVHMNPDPDALGSAFALCYIAEKLGGLKSSIAYSGDIGRIENRVMVSTLHIHLKQIFKIKYSKYDLFALVDTQPRAGNNDFPKKRRCHIVIDHHPKRRNTIAEIIAIDTRIGATATILVHWLIKGGWSIPTDIATSLVYAISSETQNMYREATDFDIDAYSFVYAKSSIKKLAMILNPRLPHSYFLLLRRTLDNALMYRNILICHIGEIPAPELVAEMADLLIRHRNTSWSFCTGHKNNLLHMSLRSKNRNAKAWRVMKKLVKEVDDGGGHNLVAGGFIRLTNTDKEQLALLFIRISSLLASELGYDPDTINWKPLIEDKEK